MMSGRDIILELVLKHEGRWDDIYSAIKNKKRPEGDLVKEYKEKGGTDFVTILDKNYPNEFKYANKPPFLFFYRGDLSLLDEEKRTVSFVGSREASKYGLEMTKKIVKGLVESGITICTGLARGIDAMAAKTALDMGGKVICVLGNGIDFCYPSSSVDLYERACKLGLVISEYPLNTPPNKENFPARNRMVAALGSGVVVGEASKRSGTLITTAFALSLNKEVGCVPYPADANSGCNMLIKEGAYMIENADDVLLMIGATKKNEIAKNISDSL